MEQSSDTKRASAPRQKAIVMITLAAPIFEAF